MSDFPAPAERHSEAYGVDIVSDPIEIALLEARNALAQMDFAMSLLNQWLSNPEFVLKFSHLLHLNRIALEGVKFSGGTFRVTPMRISNSAHSPPDPEDVPDLIEDFCTYINDNFHRKSPLHLAAYALWRLNWIHPFVDGNGRTSRVVSYLLLSARLGFQLPGHHTIPEQIAANKTPYYAALDAADRAFLKGEVDVSAMEEVISSCLAQQLLDVHGNATAAAPSMVSPRVPTLVVRYNYADGTYTPKYLLSVSETIRTAKYEKTDNWIEKNPVLVTAVSTIIAAFLGYLLPKFF